MCFTIFLWVEVQLIEHVPAFSFQLLLVRPGDVWRRIFALEGGDA
jgi:hypothetical protein